MCLAQDISSNVNRLECGFLRGVGLALLHLCPDFDIQVFRSCQSKPSVGGHRRTAIEVFERSTGVGDSPFVLSHFYWLDASESEHFLSRGPGPAQSSPASRSLDRKLRELTTSLFTPPSSSPQGPVSSSTLPPP